MGKAGVLVGSLLLAASKLSGSSAAHGVLAAILELLGHMSG